MKPYTILTLLSVGFFALVILRPLWDFSAGTLYSSVDFITGWVLASAANRLCSE